MLWERSLTEFAGTTPFGHSDDVSITRDNHYVPQWYQKGFLTAGRDCLAYLDLTPDVRPLPGGRSYKQKALFTSSPARCFVERDLYSTFFGRSVSDAIERHLFGSIDVRGAQAVRAFATEDQREWHRHFRTLFEYLDIQKLRTPKGLDWLRGQYPQLDQNELMEEMVGIAMMHCTIWTEGVREIVSAEDAGVKFIISDHPVTVFNPACSPNDRRCIYPDDPSIALKGSQTIFPLTQDFCLILTNLEYAKAPSSPPLEKRTFARNFRQSMVRTDKFIRTRRLSNADVTQINYIIKARARRFIAAGNRDWLFPEKLIEAPWADLNKVILPPSDRLWDFGGELFVKYEDGHVHYQDEFGRSEKRAEWLAKPVAQNEPKPSEGCGCGSGQKFSTCCMRVPAHLRPTWSERSIRERNLLLERAANDILGFNDGKDWTAIRRNITDEQVSEIYTLYAALWPPDTDLLQLLPKPDGRPRAIFTGSIHPESLTEFAQSLPLYFGKIFIQHPLTHAHGMSDEFSPIASPRSFHGEFLKQILCFLTLTPLIRAGVVELFPDPCCFDAHLRDQMMQMADERTRFDKFDLETEPRLKEQREAEQRRLTLELPWSYHEAKLRKAFPAITAGELEDVRLEMQARGERDPLVPLRDGLISSRVKGRGQLRVVQMVPNFEMAMYLAQATGAVIVTDSAFRWSEIQRAARPRNSSPTALLPQLAKAYAEKPFLFPATITEMGSVAVEAPLQAYASHLSRTIKYVSSARKRGRKPNVEQQLAGEFSRIHSRAQALIRHRKIASYEGLARCVVPKDGLQDNTINRLLLMSSSEHHTQNVPMAFYIERRVRKRQAVTI